MSQLLHFSAEIEIARRIRRAIAILSPRSAASQPTCEATQPSGETRTVRFSPDAVVPTEAEQNVCLDPSRCGFGRCRGICRDWPPAA